METIYVNKQDIRNAILNGDNCEGYYVFIVDEDGSYYVGWQNNRGEDYFLEKAIILPIPALWPDGTGNEGIEARECVERNLVVLEGFKNLKDVEDYCDQHNLSTTEFCEQRLADDWQAVIESGIDFLMNNWMLAINEGPNDLYPNEDLYASEMDEYGMPLHIDRQFQFVWEE